MTLTEFVLARLSEREAVAKAATPGPWVAEYSKASGHCVIDTESTNCLDSVARTTHFNDSADATHIARHDPARVLREVAAMRAMLREWTSGLSTVKGTTSMASQARGPSCAVASRRSGATTRITEKNGRRVRRSGPDVSD